MSEMRDDQLDDLLDAWRVEPATMALRDTVLAGAPIRRRGLSLRLLAGPRLWLAGAGVAAGLAGISCGALVSTAAIHNARDEALVASAFPEGVGAVVPAEGARSL